MARAPMLFLAELLLMGSGLFAQKVAEIPMEFHDNVIFIKLHINGSKALNFMFDSGAGTTVLNRSSADVLDLEYDGESRLSTSGGVLVSRSSPGNTIQIGKATLDQITLEEIPLDHLSGYFKLRLDGIIGYDLFKRLVILIDADRKVMALYDSIARVQTANWAEVPLHRIDNNKAGIEISLSGRDSGYTRKIVIVDTGNPDEIHLFPNAIQDNHIALKIRNKEVRGFSADSTITRNLRGTLEEVKFAGKKWRNVSTVIPTDSLTRAAFVKNKSYGLIGQGLLLDFNMIYDYPNNRFYFQKRK
jgi:hypothetical protein